jgi:hypothetical protein
MIDPDFTDSTESQGALGAASPALDAAAGEAQPYECARNRQGVGQKKVHGGKRDNHQDSQGQTNYAVHESLHLLLLNRSLFCKVCTGIRFASISEAGTRPAVRLVRPISSGRR